MQLANLECSRGGFCKEAFHHRRQKRDFAGVIAHHLDKCLYFCLEVMFSSDKVPIGCVAGFCVAHLSTNLMALFLGDRGEILFPARLEGNVGRWL